MSGLPSRLLRRYDPPKEAKKPIISVDIETRRIGDGFGDHRDFLLGAYSREGEEEIVYFHSPEEWLRAVILDKRNRGHVWYAHNGGEFDYKFLIPAIKEMQRERPELRCDIVTQGNGGRVIGLVFKYQKRRYELRDSFALVSTSLKRFAGQFSATVQKRDFDWATTEFDPLDPEHRAYLEHDVLSLKAALLAFFALVEEHFHVPCGWTIAASAMRAWRYTLPRTWGFWRQTDEVEGFTRRCYYGGLVFLTGTQPRRDALAVDVNSMYPFVMRTFGVPTGSAAHVVKRDPRFPGFYRVIARIAEDAPFTCIPRRDPKGALSWPTGEFETWVCSVDIDLGLELGYEFEIIEGYEFDKIEHLYNPFVTTCERLRLEYKGTAVEAAAKIFQNGLYGKFGTKPLSTAYVQSADDLSDEYTPSMDESTGEFIEGLYEKIERLDAPYIMPHWAAWITAQARAYLVRMCRAIGFAHVYYGDTDSITADRAAVEAAIARGEIEIGARYGQLKIEHEYALFMAGAPKLYYGVHTDGTTVAKAKGVPKRVAAPEHVLAAMELRETVMRAYRTMDAREVRALEALSRLGAAPREGYNPATGEFTFDSTNSTLGILKRDVRFWTARKRRVSHIANSVGWRMTDEEGTIRPIHLAPMVPEKRRRA